METLRAWARALATTGTVVALDQATKQIAIRRVGDDGPVDLIFGFKLSNVRNEGIAFGLLGGAGDTAVIALTLGALSMLVAYFAVHATRPDLWLAVGLAVGGALGNLADRVRIGAAIDFIDPPVWPAFNLADVAIVGGVAWLALMLLSPEPQPEHDAAG